MSEESIAEGCPDCGCPLEICCGERLKAELKKAIIVQREIKDGSIITMNNQRGLCYIDLKLLKQLGLSSEKETSRERGKK